MGEVFEIEVVPEKKLFYGNDFGVYACSTDQDELVKLNTYGNFVLSGNMQELKLGEKYSAAIIQTTNKKYGLTYEVQVIKQNKPKTTDEQHKYLYSILPESQVLSIIKRYPTEDIISLIENNEFDYNSIKGIAKKTYNKIRQKVLDNFEIQEALVELSQYGVTYKTIKKLIEHFGGNPSIVVQKVKENIYILCEVDSLGFKKVDEYAKQMGVKEDSPYRIGAAMTYVLTKEENEGHCWIPIPNALEKISEATGLDVDFLSEIYKQIPKDNYKIENGNIGLMRNYYYESEIAKKIEQLLKDSGNFKVDLLDEKILEVEKEQGFSFTEEQRQAIVLSVKKNVVVITGRAGSGKTSILKGIIKVMHKYTYATCALSGKAAQRIVESTGLESSTIHRLLGFNPSGGFMFGKNCPLSTDILVLDEGSMANGQISYNLFTAIKKSGKLIICGDIEQLLPIGASAVMTDIINSRVVPVVELTHVHRQALKSGILLAANQIREGIQINDANNYEDSIVGELKDLHLIPFYKGQSIFDYIVDLCKKAKDSLDINDFQVIVPMKERGDICTKNINIALQKIFNSGDSPIIRRKGYEYKIGDKIIKNGNDYENLVFNGTLGFITDINESDNSMKINFSGVGEVEYEGEDINNLDMAYALSCHRFQGSQCVNTIVALDFSAYKLLNRQWVYTAITRASKKCVFLFENDALRYAISKDDSTKRNTYLVDLLRDVSVDEDDSMGGKIDGEIKVNKNDDANNNIELLRGI